MKSASSRPSREEHEEQRENSQPWQEKILAHCERILQRQLTDVETSFVRAREGFVALEMIEDSVSQMSAVELAAYFNSGQCG